MQRFARFCREPGCGVDTSAVSGFCTAHELGNYAREARKALDRERKQDSVWRLYNSVRWQRLKKTLEAQGNVICGRLIDGKRCTRPVEIWHHLLSPRERPDLFYKISNLVGLCRICHPIEAGTPHWRENVDYVPTVWRLPTF